VILRLGIVFIILALSAKSVISTRTIVPLEDRVKTADLIVIGTLGDIVPGRYSVTYHRYFMNPAEIESQGERDRELFYNSGTINIERVLKGKTPRKSIPFSYYRNVLVNGERSSISTMEDYSFYSGDRGIWLLQKDTLFIRSYGVNNPDNLVPLDSLDVVLKILSDLEAGD
jgi:hypothetical protein